MPPFEVRVRATPTDVPAMEGLDTLLSRLAPADAEQVRSLVERGQRHEARLQLLQQIAVSLARTLDEGEIIEELARGARRAVTCEGVVVARVDLDRSQVEVVHHVVNDAVLPSREAALGSGPLGEAARRGEPVHVSPYDPALSALAAADDVVAGAASVGAVLAVPLMHGRRLLGVVALHDPRPDAFDGDAREVIEILARHAAGALSNARLFADSERERRQSEAMAEIARAVGESLKMGEVLRLILRHAVALLQAEGATIALRSGDYLHVVSALGIAELLTGVHLPVVGSLSGRVATTGVPVVTNDLGAEPEVHRPTLRLIEARESVMVPLRTARGILGVISVYNRGRDFTTADARVLHRLADQVAVAVVNARLYEEVRDATREWSAAFDSIGVGMCLVNEEGRITRSNSRALQLTVDGEVRLLIGRAFYEVVLGATPEADGDPLARAIEDGIQARTVCEGSNERWLDIMAVPHPSGGAIVTFDDVSTQRAAWDRHRLIVEASADALCTLDREGRVIFANPAARQLFAREALTGALWGDLVLHAMADEARVHVQLAATNVAQRHEYVVVRGDGERRVVAAALAPMHEREHVAMVVVSLHDVTDERRAREAVSASEARYRQLFDTASDAVLTLNLAGAITSANPVACEVFDTPGDQLLGRNFPPFLALGDMDRVTTFLRDTRHGEARRWECQIVRRNGAVRTVAITASPMREGRVVVGLLLVARDVSDDRARTDILQRSEARYAQLVETASDAIFVVDEEGNFTSVNRAFEAATGRGRDAITGHHFTTLLDPRDREAIWELFVSALHGQRRQREVRYLDAGGRSSWGSLVASPIIDQGLVTGVMGIVRDVSTEKRLHDELLRRERLAAVGQMLGGVAHELNNPLAAVLAFSELLLETPAEEPADRDSLAMIGAEARRAARILNDLMELTLDRPAQPAPLRLTDVVAQALAVRRYSLGVSGITVHEVLPDDLPTTYGDARRLQQAVLHLLARAENVLREWPGEKRLTVRVSRAADALVLEVQDSGPGIAPSELSRVFVPRRPSRELSDLSGVGLTLAAGIFREHGGRIHVDSSPGEGATFVVEIPIVAAPNDARASRTSRASSADAPAATAGNADDDGVTEDPAQLRMDLGLDPAVALSGPAASAIGTERARQPTRAGALHALGHDAPGDANARSRGVPASASLPLDVLVVDDEPAIRAALTHLLERLGHRVWVARDGEEGRRALDERHVDRVLLDLRMPRLGGDALFHELRLRRPDLLPRIIFLTGDAERESAHVFLRDSGCLTLRKPFTLDDVRRALVAPASAGR